MLRLEVDQGVGGTILSGGSGGGIDIDATLPTSCAVFAKGLDAARRRASIVMTC